MADKILAVAHVTGKAGVRELGLLRGKGNFGAMEIASVTYPPGSLVFLGFVAPVPTDLSPGEKTWEGVLRFKAGKSTVEDRHDFVGGVRGVVKDAPAECFADPDKEREGDL